MLEPKPVEAIRRALEASPAESPEQLALTEERLREPGAERFEMPDPGEPVLALASGGIGSTVTLALLLARGHEVYPVYVRSGQRPEAGERAALEAVVGALQRGGAGALHDPLVLEGTFPAAEVRWGFERYASAPDPSREGLRFGDPFAIGILCTYGAQAAYFYEMTRQIRIRTVFTGHCHAPDADRVEESLTSLRAANLGVRLITHDVEWRYCALPIETDLGHLHTRAELAAWARANDLDLGPTWSCRARGEEPCGECTGCRRRAEALGGAS